MIVTVKNLDVEVLDSFWIEYPQFKLKSPFSDLYKRDKSKDKKKSSLVMWLLSLIYCRDSMYADIQPVEERKQFLVDDLIPKSLKIDWEGSIIHPTIILKDVEQAYIELSLSQAERTLHAWEGKLYEFQKLLEDNEVTFDMEEDDMNKMMKIIDKLPKMFEMHNKTRGTVLEESNVRNKGGAESSLSDEGAI